MTFKKLKELIEKYKIPSNVKLLSDSGWEVDETEMDGVFYNEKENHIVFTQDLEYSGDYSRNKNYIMLEEIEELENE